MEGREKKDEKTLNKIPRIDAEYMEKYILSTIKMINRYFEISWKWYEGWWLAMFCSMLICGIQWIVDYVAYLHDLWYVIISSR